MATPITPPVTDTPTARTAEGVGTTATPTARTAVTPATTAVPTARGAITPSTTPVPTARTSLTPATTAIPTARSAVTPSSNPTPTAVGPLSPVAALRTGGDVVNLDFCGESYNVDFDYSRASSGSYIGRNLNQFNQYDYVLKNNFVGDVENLALYSEQFNNAAWVKDDVTVLANSIAAPDKTKTADKVIDNTVSSGHTLSLSSQTVVSGSIYNLSVYAKAGTSSKIGLYDIDSSDGYMFDLLNGTILSIFETPVSAFMQYVGDGWYRCSISITAASTALKFTVYLESFAAYVGTGKFLYLHGAQATLGIKTLPYVQTLATAVTKSFTASPRIEYDAATGECLGYLAEGASTNLALRSEEFNNAYWTKFNASISSNNSIAPDGTQSADKLLETTSNASHSVYKDLTVTPGVFTRSCYVKASERIFCVIRQFDGETNKSAFFNLQTGVIGTVDAGITANIESAGNGWFRCSVTYTTAETSERIQIGAAIVDGTANYIGDTAKGILIWGAQMEAVSSFTSYIRTEGSAVTRAADNLEMLSVGYNQQEGTLFTESYYKGVIGSQPVIATLSDTTTNNRIASRLTSTGANQILISTGSVLQETSSGAIAPVNQKNKIALTFKSGQAISYLNKLSDAVGTYSVLPTQPLGLQVGQRGDNTSQFFGNISKVTLYNYALTADEVKAL